MGISPKVSVLIPTYRYGRFLRQAIESVLNQTYTDFELIVSDDASPDDSAAIIAEYSARDPRIRGHCHRANLGMVQNWNWCLEQARGEFVKFVFGDDLLCSPDSLGTLVRLLELEPRAALAACARAVLDERSHQIDLWDEMGTSGYYPGGQVINCCFNRERNLVGEPSAVLFRRESAQRGFDLSLRQLVDEEFWFHLLTRGGMVYTSTPLCGFRRHGAQQTALNQPSGIATAENVRIIIRYFGHYAAAWGVAVDSFAMRRRLFRHIYYSRKDRTRPAIAAAVIAEMQPHLPGLWYPVCWMLHRLCKPFENLCRWFDNRRLAAQKRPFSSKIALSEV
jgi:glycosyltransferase involved in cell wall biosynthesis